jgi:CDP-2,3-bis-(O-geranylgeranyl)-sn-glycerol synthase
VRLLWPSVQDWLSALYIILPIYFTNGAPVLFGGGRPLDSGKILFDGQRVLGDHKTFRGFASGIAVGLVVGLFEFLLISQNLLLIAIVASLGALLGDLAGAFLKRRLKIEAGGPFPVVDQLDFVIGAILLVSIVSGLSFWTVLILLLVTPPIHLLTNVGAHTLGLKSTYW